MDNLSAEAPASATALPAIQATHSLAQPEVVADPTPVSVPVQAVAQPSNVVFPTAMPTVDAQQLLPQFKPPPPAASLQKTATELSAEAETKLQSMVPDLYIATQLVHSRKYKEAKKKLSSAKKALKLVKRLLKLEKKVKKERKKGKEKGLEPSPAGDAQQQAPCAPEAVSVPTLSVDAMPPPPLPFAMPAFGMPLPRPRRNRASKATPSASAAGAVESAPPAVGEGGSVAMGDLTLQCAGAMPAGSPSAPRPPSPSPAPHPPHAKREGDGEDGVPPEEGGGSADAATGGHPAPPCTCGRKQNHKVGCPRASGSAAANKSAAPVDLSKSLEKFGFKMKKEAPQPGNSADADKLFPSFAVNDRLVPTRLQFWALHSRPRSESAGPARSNAISVDATAGAAQCAATTSNKARRCKNMEFVPGSKYCGIHHPLLHGSASAGPCAFAIRNKQPCKLYAIGHGIDVCCHHASEEDKAKVQAVIDGMDPHDVVSVSSSEDDASLTEEPERFVPMATPSPLRVPLRSAGAEDSVQEIPPPTDNDVITVTVPKKDAIVVTNEFDDPDPLRAILDGAPQLTSSNAGKIFRNNSRFLDRNSLSLPDGFCSEVILIAFFSDSIRKYETRPAYYGTWNSSIQNVQRFARFACEEDIPRVTVEDMVEQGKVYDYDDDSGDDWDSEEVSGDDVMSGGGSSSEDDDSLSESEIADFINDDVSFVDSSDEEENHKLLERAKKRDKTKLRMQLLGPFIGVPRDAHPFKEKDFVAQVRPGTCEEGLLEMAAQQIEEASAARQGRKGEKVKKRKRREGPAATGEARPDGEEANEPPAFPREMELRAVLKEHGLEDVDLSTLEPSVIAALLPPEPKPHRKRRRAAPTLLPDGTVAPRKRHHRRLNEGEGSPSGMQQAKLPLFVPGGSPYTPAQAEAPLSESNKGRQPDTAAAAAPPSYSPFDFLGGRVEENAIEVEEDAPREPPVIIGDSDNETDPPLARKTTTDPPSSGLAAAAAATTTTTSPPQNPPRSSGFAFLASCLDEDDASLQ